MKAKGLTVTTLCHTIDPEGSGEISSDELVAAVEKMMMPSGASRAALKKAREKEAARLAESEARRARARELQEKMYEMEESGALNCLLSLEHFMRKNCLRISDLFSKMDSSGDGFVSAEELRRGMKNVGLKMKRKDVVLFVRYVDLDGGGEVGKEELENAIRELRRFNWEKDNINKLINSSGAPLPLRCSSLLHIWRPKNAQYEPLESIVNNNMNTVNTELLAQFGFNDSKSDISGTQRQQGVAAPKSPAGSRAATPAAPNIDYMLTGDDVCAGLMRMRGDGDEWLWKSYSVPVPAHVRASPSRASRGGGSRGGGSIDSLPPIDSSPRKQSKKMTKLINDKKKDEKCKNLYMGVPTSFQ